MHEHNVNSTYALSYSGRLASTSNACTKDLDSYQAITRWGDVAFQTIDYVCTRIVMLVQFPVAGYKDQDW